MVPKPAEPLAICSKVDASRSLPMMDCRGIRNAECRHAPTGADVMRRRQNPGIKGGAKRLDAKSLHRAPKSTPDASRTSPPGGFLIHTAPSPKTPCHARLILETS